MAPSGRDYERGAGAVMSLIQPTRRGLIGALIAGPAIVRVASIMPVRGMPLEDPFVIETARYNGRDYLLIKHKCEDGIIRSSRVLLG